MGNYKITEIASQVYMLEERDVCIYLVVGDTSALVIDSGYGLSNLKEEIEKITDKPLILVVTHGHMDHIFGGRYFDKVYIKKEELTVYQIHRSLVLTMKNEIKRAFGLSDEHLDILENASIKNFEFIEVGHFFDIGGNVLEVISLKGHTPGCVGILDRKHRILFTSDGLNTHIWMQLPESSTLVEYIDVLEGLEAYKSEFDTMYMGHNGDNKPVLFIDTLKETLKQLINGVEGAKYNNPVAPGWIHRYRDSEVVYIPEKIK